MMKDILKIKCYFKSLYLPDNRVVKVTKIGNVISYFDVFGKENFADMKNVYCIKDMKFKFD